MDDTLRELNHFAFTSETDPFVEDTDFDEMEEVPSGFQGILNLTYPVDPKQKFPSVTMSYQISPNTTPANILGAMRSFYNQRLSSNNIAAYRQFPEYVNLRTADNTTLYEVFEGYRPLGLIKNPGGYQLVFVDENDENTKDNFSGL